jgi:hypothetical protein
MQLVFHYQTTDVKIIFLHDDIHLFKSKLISVLPLMSL